GREARDRGVQSATRDDQQREAGPDLLIVDADGALLIEWHSSLSLHSVVFWGCSRRDTQHEYQASAERHADAAPRLCGHSCTRSGAAGQGWHPPGGGKHDVPRLHSMASAALETPYRTGSAHCMCRHHQDMVVIA